jgi:magnesium transporter
MISRFTHRTVSWIDLEEPTRDELSVIADENNLHPVVTNELFQPSERAKVDMYTNAIYLILHFPVRNTKTGAITEAEIDFVLLKEKLITTHYELIEPLKEFAKQFEVGQYLDKNRIESHAGYLFFFAVRELYTHTLSVIEATEKRLREAEKLMYSGREAEAVTHISACSQTMSEIRHSVRYHKETLSSLAGACKQLYGEDFAYYVRAIEGEYLRVEKAIVENRHMIKDLRKTNDSLISARNTKALERLTAIVVTLFPLGFLSWIFGMDSVYLQLNDPLMLGAVFAIMAVSVLLFFLYFRSKKWL